MAWRGALKGQSMALGNLQTGSRPRFKAILGQALLQCRVPRQLAAHAPGRASDGPAGSTSSRSRRRAQRPALRSPAPGSGGGARGRRGARGAGAHAQKHAELGQHGTWHWCYSAARRTARRLSLCSAARWWHSRRSRRRRSRSNDASLCAYRLALALALSSVPDYQALELYSSARRRSRRRSRRSRPWRS